ncbi:MAG: phosphopantetheine-binding protein [Pseudomonadota bacterium]
MSNNEMTAAQGSDDVENGVISVINEMVSDWDLDNVSAISPGTSLMGDLEFESIDIVQLAVHLEQHFEQSGLPFEQLFMRDGDYVDDLTIQEIAGFLRDKLAS